MEPNGVKNGQVKLRHARLSHMKNENDLPEDTISDESGYLMRVCGCVNIKIDRSSTFSSYLTRKNRTACL